MKIVAIIQARLSSERLPGKVLKEIIGIPMIKHIYDRACRSKRLEKVILATSIDSLDNKLAEYAEESGMNLFRGSLNNVLERYYKCAKENDADMVVRLTGDNACVDADIIDRAIEIFEESDLDYLSYARELPLGLSVEVFSFEALKNAYYNATTDICKEHVTPYLYKNGDVFKWLRYSDESLKDRGGIRITTDTEEDFCVITKIFEYFGNNQFGYEELIKVLDEHPDWLEINKEIEQVKV